MNPIPDNAAQPEMECEATSSVAVEQKPYVSVIIAVYNDTGRLRHCLSALISQSYPPDSYEIVVVDNGSTDDIGPLRRDFPTVRFLHEASPGSYVARNTGIETARGEVIAFTDSDCIPDQTWIEEGVHTLVSDPDVGLVAGKIELFAKDPERPTAVELYEVLAGFDQRGYIAEKHFGATANVFTHRRVIDAVGLFNPALKSGGDKEWGQRVFAAGFKQHYSPSARVMHPARHSFQELYRKISRITWSGNQRKRLRTILGDYWRALIPPVRDIAAVWGDGQLVGWRKKIAYVGVLVFIRWVMLYEFTRQLLGGQQQR